MQIQALIICSLKLYTSFCYYSILIYLIFSFLYQLLSKVEALYAEMSSVLYSIDQRISMIEHEFSDISELHNHVMELQELLTNEKSYYNVSSNEE